MKYPNIMLNYSRMSAFAYKQDKKKKMLIKPGPA